MRKIRSEPPAADERVREGWEVHLDPRQLHEQLLGDRANRRARTLEGITTLIVNIRMVTSRDVLHHVEDDGMQRRRKVREEVMAKWNVSLDKFLDGDDDGKAREARLVSHRLPRKRLAEATRRIHFKRGYAVREGRISIARE